MEAAESRGSPVIPVNRGLYERLIRAARSGQPITYAEVGRLLELSMDYPPHRTEIFQLLGVISRHEAAKGRPMLTSVVLDRTEATPGKTFYRLGQELGLVQPSEDEISFAIRQLNDTFAFWQARDAPSVEQALRSTGEEVVPQQALLAPEPGQRQALGLPFGEPEDEQVDQVDAVEDALDEPLLAGPVVDTSIPPSFGQISSVRPTPAHAPAPSAPRTAPGSPAGPTYAHSPRLPEAQPRPADRQAPADRQPPADRHARAPDGQTRLPEPADAVPDLDSPGRAAAAGVAGGPSVAAFAGGQVARPPIRVADAPAQTKPPQVPATGAPAAPAQQSPGGTKPAAQAPGAQPGTTPRPATPLTGNKAIEDAAIRWVMQLERAAGRNPVDRRYEAAFAGDIDSSPRCIEVKAVGTSTRGWFLPLEVSQMEEARRNRNFYVYVVENTKQGDPTKFTLKVLGGTRLQQLLLGAKERRYYEVPWPTSHYDATAGLEALSGHGPDVSAPAASGTRSPATPNGATPEPIAATPVADRIPTEG